MYVDIVIDLVDALEKLIISGTVVGWGAYLMIGLVESNKYLKIIVNMDAS